MLSTDFVKQFSTAEHLERLAAKCLIFKFSHLGRLLMQASKIKETRFKPSGAQSLTGDHFEE